MRRGWTRCASKAGLEGDRRSRERWLRREGGEGKAANPRQSELAHKKGRFFKVLY